MPINYSLFDQNLDPKKMTGALTPDSPVATADMQSAAQQNTLQSYLAPKQNIPSDVPAQTPTTLVQTPSREDKLMDYLKQREQQASDKSLYSAIGSAVGGIAGGLAGGGPLGLAKGSEIAGQGIQQAQQEFAQSENVGQKEMMDYLRQKQNQPKISKVETTDESGNPMVALIDPSGRAIYTGKSPIKQQVVGVDESGNVMRAGQYGNQTQALEGVEPKPTRENQETWKIQKGVSLNDAQAKSLFGDQAKSGSYDVQVSNLGNMQPLGSTIQKPAAYKPSVQKLLDPRTGQVVFADVTAPDNAAKLASGQLVAGFRPQVIPNKWTGESQIINPNAGQSLTPQQITNKPTDYSTPLNKAELSDKDKQVDAFIKRDDVKPIIAAVDNGIRGIESLISENPSNVKHITSMVEALRSAGLTRVTQNELQMTLGSQALVDQAMRAANKYFDQGTNLSGKDVEDLKNYMRTAKAVAALQLEEKLDAVSKKFSDRSPAFQEQFRQSAKANTGIENDSATLADMLKIMKNRSTYQQALKPLPYLNPKGK